MKTEFTFGLFRVAVTILVADLNKPENNRLRIDWIKDVETGQSLGIDDPSNTPQLIDSIERYTEAMLPAIVRDHDQERRLEKDIPLRPYTPRGYTNDEYEDGEIALVLASMGINF